MLTVTLRSFKFHFLVAISTTLMSAQTPRFRDYVPLGVNLSHQTIPIWNGGGLAILPRDSVATATIRFIGLTGGESTPISFTLPGASSIKIFSAAQAQDGWTVLSGMAYDREGRGGGFVSIISSDRQSVTTIQAFPYCPYFARFSPDGSVWTLGIEMIKANPDAKAIQQDHALVRHFDREGKKIGSYIPKNGLSEIPAFALVNDVMSGLFMVCKDRVGWYASRAGRYFELSPTGLLTQYPGIPNSPDSDPVSGMALTDSGATMVSANRVYSLDRKSRTWSVVTLPGGSARTDAVIFGGSGDVIATDDKDLKDMLFFEVK